MIWRPYPNDRLIEERPEGFVVIVPVDAPAALPIDCSTCGYALRSHEDEASYREFGCCDRCARLWAWPRRAAWTTGWRPTVDEVALSEADRVPSTVVIK